MVVAVSEGCKKLEPINPACITIKSIKPASAHYGEIVEIKGDNFVPGHPQLYKIYIAGKLISDSYIVDVPDSGTLRFKIPDGIGGGKLSVSRTGAVPCNSRDSIEFIYKLTIINTKVFFQDNANPLTPSGLDVDQRGNIVFADELHNQIKKFGSNGQILWTAGKQDISCILDHNQINAVCFFSPQDAAITSSTDIAYVADAGHNCIRKIEGGYVDVYGGAINSPGDNDGTIASSRFTAPTGLAVTENGSFYTIESNKNRLRFVDVNANTVITLIGKVPPSPLNLPARITYSQKRNPKYPVLIADLGNKRILQVNPTDHNDIKTLSIDLNFNPYDLAVDQFGDIIVLDQDINPSNNRILIIYTDNTIVDLREENLHYDFKYLTGIAIDINNNRIYVSDQKANKIIEIDYK